jgi:molecular chaperone GrpE
VKHFHRELQKVFKQFGIEEFNPIGQEFDPNTQESMIKLNLPEGLTEGEKKQKSGKVADCFRTGYMIKGRLLRSAHVVVYE